MLGEAHALRRSEPYQTMCCTVLQSLPPYSVHSDSLYNIPIRTAHVVPRGRVFACDLLYHQISFDLCRVLPSHCGKGWREREREGEDLFGS